MKLKKQNETSSIILDDFIPRAVKEREYYEVRNYKNIIPEAELHRLFEKI